MRRSLGLVLCLLGGGANGATGRKRIVGYFSLDNTMIDRFVKDDCSACDRTCVDPKLFPQGSSHEYSEVGQGIASIARSKAVYSAIDSHALGGLKTRMVFANSTARKTEV